MTAQLVSLLLIGLAGAVLAMYSLDPRPMRSAVIRKPAYQRR